MSHWDFERERSEMVAQMQKALRALPSDLGAALNGKVVFANGCSGFFGIWTLCAAAALEQSGARVKWVVQTRSKEQARARLGGWAGLAQLTDLSAASWMQGQGRFDFGLHMLARSDAQANKADPLGVLCAMASSAAEMAQACIGAAAPMLYVSSGAVYGKRQSKPGGVAFFSEEDRSAGPDCLDPGLAYGQGKRTAEAMVACMGPMGLVWTIARPFAFLGAHLPMDAHFAAGNFLKDAWRGSPITITGDGLPVRSYMHPADAVAWQLWLMSCGPRFEAVNVGSGDARSLESWAKAISAAAGSPEPVVLSPKARAADCYAPDLGKAKKLGLVCAHGASQSIDLALDWLRQNNGQWRAGQGAGSSE